MKCTVHLALLLGLTHSLVAESLQVRSWHVEDGLPDGTVTALAQTPNGLLWVGTRKGLVRFDGARFVRAQSWDAASPEDSRVAGLLVNRQGALWVAGETGLVMEFVDGHARVRSLPTPQESFENDQVPGQRGAGPVDNSGERIRWHAFSPLAMDGAGSVWAFSPGRGLFRFHGPGPPTWVPTDGLAAGPVRAFLNDRPGRIWLLTEFQASVLRDGRWISYPLDSASLVGWTVACPTGEQGFWLAAPGEPGGENGFVCHWVDGQIGASMDVPLPVGSRRAALSVVLEDRRRRLWVSRWWSGLHR